MGDAFKAFQISDRVYWVGAIDWELRNFHGYLTSRGTTYNAYLILADKITLIDTVKASFTGEMLARIASVVDPSRIDYIVSNHAEMDHSGSLPQVVTDVRPEKVVASPKGVQALRDHLHWDVPVEAVKTGERLELGGDAIRFVEARMLHWPDSMFSYLEGERELFTNDAFGMHYAGAERFADELEPTVWRYEAAKYFANILLPFSSIITRFLEKLPAHRFELGMIAPDHGPIWRREPERIVQLYAEWAAQPPTRKAVVVYDTMWQSTARMAHAVGEGLSGGGATVQLMPLGGSHRSDVATEILEAGALIVGSPTMNGQIYPTLADVLTYLSGLKRKNLVGAAFGSYGWGGEAVRQLEDWLRGMKVDVMTEGVKARYVPDEAALTACRSLGEAVAARLSEHAARDADSG